MVNAMRLVAPVTAANVQEARGSIAVVHLNPIHMQYALLQGERELS